MHCLLKQRFSRTTQNNNFKCVISLSAFFYILLIALFTNNNMANAAKLDDGTWTQPGSPGTTTVSYTNTTALAASSDIVLTFPDSATVDQDGTGISVTGQTTPTRSNNTLDNTITITLDGTISAGLSVTITMTDALSAYTDTNYAQESLAINTQDPTDTPVDFGIALITNDNTTLVTTQVPLFVTLEVDTTEIDLGTLSTASVKEADQTYTVDCNNRSGVTIQIATDGELDDGFGNDINQVSGGTVDAGSEEYGISVDNVSDLTIDPTYIAGDNPIIEAADNIATSNTEIANATFDINYKASIAGTTIAGSYNQVVTVTIATNS